MIASGQAVRSGSGPKASLMTLRGPVKSRSFAWFFGGFVILNDLAFSMPGASGQFLPEKNPNWFFNN